MEIKGWLIVGGNGGLPQQAYCGDCIGPLPHAMNYKVGQWFLWRPVNAVIAGLDTQMTVVCVKIPMEGE